MLSCQACVCKDRQLLIVLSATEVSSLHQIKGIFISGALWYLVEWMLRNSLYASFISLKAVKWQKAVLTKLRCKSKNLPWRQTFYFSQTCHICPEFRQHLVSPKQRK